MVGPGRRIARRRLRRRLSVATMVIAAVALIVSMIMPAQAQAAGYSGPTKRVAWQLAPGITDLASLRANPGAKQTYYGSSAPACTATGKVAFQVDIYRYGTEKPEGSKVTYRQFTDSLIAGGINYLWPKIPNDKFVFLSATIVKPPMCKPDKPNPDITTDKEQDQSCEAGVRERTKTTTVDWVWSGSKYVKGKPVITYGDWAKVRDLNPAEKAKLGCKQPDKPKPITKTAKERDLSCELGVRVRTVTTTVDWTWNAEQWDWVKSEPVVTTSDWETVRPLNPAEKAKLGCDKPGAPDDAVVSDKEYAKSCEYGLQVRTITTTTKPFWNEKKWEWQKGKPVVTYSDWQKVRDLTAEEKAQLGCGKPDRPKTTTKVVDSRQWNDCKALWRQDKIQTTKPQWSNADWKWVKGSPTYSFSEVVKVRDLTQAEKVKYGCVAKPPTETKVPPKSIYPVQAETGGVDEIVETVTGQNGNLARGAFIGLLIGIAGFILSSRRESAVTIRR